MTSRAAQDAIILLTLLCGRVYNQVMADIRPDPRPDIEADASRDEALFWTSIYGEILDMEEKVLARAWELMTAQSQTARRRVSLTNVSVIEAQSARFRDRLGYWEERLRPTP